jgi:hypothetical protein
MHTRSIQYRLSISLLIFIVALALQFCDDEVVEPDPSSLDFVWEVDTLLPEAWQYIGLSIWGTSETNVYVGGHDSDGGGRQSLLRYDGLKWRVINVRSVGLSTIESISGIDSSNFVVVGDGGRLVHAGRYRHGVWDTLRLPWLRPPVMNVHMVSPTEIYFCGPDGVLRHDGTNYTWIVDSSKTDRIPFSAGPYVPTEIRKAPDGNVYWMTSYALTPPRIQLDMYNGDSVITIDRSITDAGNPVQRSSRYLRRIGSKLVTGNGAAYSVLDGGMTFEHEVDGRLYAGTDVRSNLFAIQWERAKIQHYNGKGWKDIAPVEFRSIGGPLLIQDAIYLNTTLFVLVYSFNGKTLVYKGRYM